MLGLVLKILGELLKLFVGVFKEGAGFMLVLVVLMILLKM